MAEPLKPLTALGKQAPVTVVAGPCRITERCDVALASLAPRLGRDADVARAAQAAGIPLPGPAQAVAGDPWSAFWVTPDMWMLEAPFASHEDVVAHLRPVFGDAASITEQTDGWVRFDLAGENLLVVLERLSSLDLAALPDGYASRTVIEHLGCYLIRHAAQRITLYGPRSSAQSLLHALEAAARSVA